MRNRCLRQTAISLSSREAEFYAASACSGELLGTRRTLQGTSLQRFSSSRDSDSARHILQRRGQGGLKHTEIRCLAIQQWVREKRLSVSRVDTKKTPQISSRNIWMDCERSRSQRNLGFDSWMVRIVQMGTTEEWRRLRACQQRFLSSKGVSILSFNSWQNVHYIDIDRCTQTSFFPCCFYLLQLVHRQTQLSWTIHSLILRGLTSGSNRPWVTKEVQSCCHLVLIHGSGASSLKSLIDKEVL